MALAVSRLRPGDRLSRAAVPAIVLVLGAAVALSACSGYIDGRLRQGLDAAKSRWSSHNVTSYRYTLFQAHGMFGAVTTEITVLDGVVASVYVIEPFDAQPGDPQRERREVSATSGLTVPQLFARIEQVASGSGRSSAQFHEQWGYPVEFTSALSGVQDARYILAVRQFEPMAEAVR